MAYFPNFLSNLLEKLLPIIKLLSAIYAILFKLLSSVRAVFRQTVKQCDFTQKPTVPQKPTVLQANIFYHLTPKM